MQGRAGGEGGGWGVWGGGVEGGERGEQVDNYAANFQNSMKKLVLLSTCSSNMDQLNKKKIKMAIKPEFVAFVAHPQIYKRMRMHAPG